MKNYVKIILLAAAAVAIAAAAFFAGVKYQKEKLLSSPVKIITKIIKDTSTFKPQKPVAQIQLPEKIKIVIPQKILDSLQLLNDSLKALKNRPLYFPKNQVVYRDSSYQAWVSGVQPKLDSIKLYNKTIEREVTRYITKYKTKRWGVGIQAGYGISPSYKQLAPYIGVGISYQLLSW